jgi:hypothetical protein
MLSVVIVMFCNDLWGFSINPPYFGYNSTKQENPVLCILTFQEPSRSQIEPRGPNETRWHGPQTRSCHPGSCESRSSDAVHLHPRNPILTYKRLYKDTPRRSLEEAAKKHKHINRGCSSKDWREKRCRSRPRSLLQHIRHHHLRRRHEEGVVHLWTMGLW